MEGRHLATRHITSDFLSLSSCLCWVSCFVDFGALGSAPLSDRLGLSSFVAVGPVSFLFTIPVD